MANLYTGLLTKADVLDASEKQEPYTHATIKRMIGGGFLDTLKSSLRWIGSKLPMVKQALQHIPHPLAQTSAKVLDAVGYGKVKSKLDDKIM